ncbi:MucR family transcriptional regulator [Hellea balneolensis]|uniref:MucR family transcriptional regulator n=1 Tax=Hellea balneolensis TaxID=287478 RepID=UPI000429C435|nr:MucR family transcriptional regulator [Hellea balneolensis]
MSGDEPVISKSALLDITADIVSAYVAHNQIKAKAVPELIDSVFAAIDAIANSSEADDDTSRPEPAVPIVDSLTDDYIICLEDGAQFQSLKRHLRVKYNLTPEAYRKKWGLPRDYPMVAPNYAKRRSELAKKTGLGKSRT